LLPPDPFYGVWPALTGVSTGWRDYCHWGKIRSDECYNLDCREAQLQGAMGLTGGEAVAQLRADLLVYDPTKKLLESMDRVEQEVRAAWDPIYLPWFTDHSANHSRRVAEYALELSYLFSLQGCPALAPFERYILYVSAWLHDLGMNDVELSPRPLGEMTREDFERVRHQHPERTKVRVLSGDGAFGLPSGDPALAEVVAFTARAHGTSYYDDSVQVLKGMTRIRNENVRGPLLAALLLMADELDLHYERAKPLPGGAALSAVSEAHAFKHRCVTSSTPIVTAGGCIGIEVRLTFPTEMPDEDCLDVERWITIKLQQQMGLVERELRAGFGRQACFDRAIKVKRGVAYADRPPLSRAGMCVVRAETTQDQMIDHRLALRQIIEVIEAGNVVVVNGAWDPEDGRDIDGREDLLATAAARSDADGSAVFRSVRLRLNGAGTLSDILDEWLAALLSVSDAGTSSYEPLLATPEPKRWRALLSQLTEKLQNAEVEKALFIVSNLDGLTPTERDCMINVVVPTLRAAVQNAAFAFSAERGSTAATGDTPVVAVAAGPVDADDLVRYMGRYAEPHAALGAAKAKLDYASYKRLAQGHEQVIRGQVA
jgi:hypothetical protein